MSKKEKVTVVALDAQSLPRAQALALRLNIAVSCDPNAVSGMVLEVSQDRLALPKEASSYLHKFILVFMIFAFVSLTGDNISNWRN